MLGVGTVLKYILYNNEIIVKCKNYGYPWSYCFTNTSKFTYLEIDLFESK